MTAVPSTEARMTSTGSPTRPWRPVIAPVRISLISPMGPLHASRVAFCEVTNSARPLLAPDRVEEHGKRTEGLRHWAELSGHTSEDDRDALLSIGTACNAANDATNDREAGYNAGNSRGINREARDNPSHGGRVDREVNREARREGEGGGESAESDRGEDSERAEGEHFVLKSGRG